MNGRTNSSGSSVNDLQIPLDPCTNLECVAGNAQVELTWTDPLNKYATPEGEVAEDPDQLVSVWHHTVVIRKVGSAPVGIDDGIVVVSSEVKNQYQSTAYIDTGLVNDTTYYYGVFAINEDGVPGIPGIESATPYIGTPISELAVGTIIKINENGAPVEFYLAKHNYESGLNGAGRELLVRKVLDYKTATSGTYMYSPARRWCTGSYYNRFSSVVKEMIGTTTFPNWPDDTNKDPVFLLSAYEGAIDISHFWDIPYEGTKLPIVSILQNDAYSSANESLQQPNWTRSNSESANITRHYYYFEHNTSGLDGDSYKDAECFCRPVFTLPADAKCNSGLQLIENLDY